jgi:hypothetical protein
MTCWPTKIDSAVFLSSGRQDSSSLKVGRVSCHYPFLQSSQRSIRLAIVAVVGTGTAVVAVVGTGMAGTEAGTGAAQSTQTTQISLDEEG